MSDYPGALDTLPTDSTDETPASGTHPALHNEANDAINAIEQTLGINPQGTFSDVAERITDVEGAVGGAGLSDHVDDPTDAHDASAISYAGGTGMSATDVEAALDELATEKQDSGAAAGGVLAGTYPNPSFAADMATQAEIDAHINDSSDAHDASAISYAGGTGMSATDVEAAIDELATEKANAADVATDAELTAHIDDTSDAHDASAISYAGGAGMSASDVEAAIDELANEKQNAGAAAGGVLAGTYPNPSFASDMATQAELDAHISDSSAAHAASAISYAGGTGMSATDVETAIDELATEKQNATKTYTFQTVHTFAVAGAIGASDTLPTFFVAEMAGQSVTLVGARHKTRSGSVTFRLLKNGAEFGIGTTGSPITADTSADTSADTEALANNDEIELDIIGSSSGVDLTVTIILEHVVS